MEREITLPKHVLGNGRERAKEDRSGEAGKLKACSSNDSPSPSYVGPVRLCGSNLLTWKLLVDYLLSRSSYVRSE